MTQPHNGDTPPIESAMTWAQYIDLRENRRQQSLRWSAAPEPAAVPLGAWRLQADPALRDAAAHTLASASLSPGPAQLWRHLAAPGALPTPPDPAAQRPAWQHHDWLAQQGGALEDAPERRLAWALAALDHCGREVERRERWAWSAVQHTPSPHDEASAALWAGWLGGQPWSLRERWEALYLSPVVRTFRGVCEARRLPKPVVTRIVRDLEEGFFYRLVGGDGVPGWAELAVRVLETDAPVRALAAALDAAAWDRLSRCAVSRGSWQESCAAVWSTLPEAGSRARALTRAGQADPDWAEAWMDLHVVRRLVRTWETRPDADAWAIISQNRGRARGRLRALVAAGATGLADRLLSLPGLHARTTAAIRRYAWAWAWQEMALDFSFDIARSVTPPCHDVATLPAPFGAGLRPAVETWVLLVVLRGRLSHLRRWVASGSTGDRDSTWARLLSDSLPDTLSEAVPGKRARSYRRLRVDLAESLDDILAAQRPLLAAVTDLGAARGLRGRFTALVDGRWDGAVPLPRSGFPSFLKNAQATLDVAEEPT